MPRLTKKFVEELEYDPAQSTHLEWDDLLAGFGVRVLPSGKKSFFYFYRTLGGKQRRVSLGMFGRLTVDNARSLALSRLGEVESGRDPVREEKIKKDTALRDIALSEFWPKFSEDARLRWKLRTRIENDRRWEKILSPKLGSKTLSSVNRRDLHSLHQSLKDTPIEGNRTLALLKSVLNAARKWGYLEGENPAVGIDPYPERTRETFLTSEQLTILMEAIDCEEAIGRDDTRKPTGVKRGEGVPKEERGISPHVASLFRLLIHTGARLSEILTLEWSFVDKDAGALRLPDSKTGKKSIWLNSLAVAELEKLAKLRSQDRWVIEGRLPGQRLVNAQKPWRRVRERAAKLAVEHRAAVKVVGKNTAPRTNDEAVFSTLRIHDLRHSFASFGIKAGVPLFMIGKALGHARQSTTERYAHIVDEVTREAANKIGQSIEAILSSKKT